MLNMSDMLRGYTDTVILAQLLDHDNYGYEINKHIRRATGGLLELKEATLYTTFRRLESTGCIRSYWGSEATGARRRYYAITAQGRALYRENLRDWQTFRSILENLLQGETDHEPET